MTRRRQEFDHCFLYHCAALLGYEKRAAAAAQKQRSRRHHLETRVVFPVENIKNRSEITNVAVFVSTMRRSKRDAMVVQK